MDAEDFDEDTTFTFIEADSRRDDPLGLLCAGQKIDLGDEIVTIKFFDKFKIDATCYDLHSVDEVYVYCDTLDETCESADEAATFYPYCRLLRALHPQSVMSVIRVALENYHRARMDADNARRRKLREEKRLKDAALRELVAASVIRVSLRVPEGDIGRTHVLVHRAELGRLQDAINTIQERFADVLAP